MKTKLLLVQLFFCMSLFSCSHIPTQNNNLKQTNASAQLAQLFADNFSERLAANPTFATAIGDDRYDDRLANTYTADYRNSQRKNTRKWLQKIKAIDREQLVGQDRLSYDIFLYSLEQSIEGEQFPGELLPISQFFNPANQFAGLGSGKSIHPFKTVKNYDDWLSRATSIPDILDQIILNMREGIKQGIVQPRALMEKTLPQLKAHIVTDPSTSIFYQPIVNFPEGFTQADKTRLSKAFTDMILEQQVPAYQRLHSFIKDEYLPKTRNTFGLSFLPNGKAWYDYRLKTFTTNDLTAEEIHTFGLSEVSRIRSEMEEVMRQVGFAGTLADWFKYVQTNPDFYYDNEEDLLQGYRDLQSKVNRLLPRMFNVAPKSDYEVRAVEAYRAESAAGASYQRGTPDGSRPGVFYVNTFNLKGQPKYGMETLSLHEAAPGHHFQIALQQEVEDLPQFRRFGGYTVFSEGWALYTESIGKEMGMFTDPMQYYGRLNDEMLRAMRLVVDTGLHAKGWSRERAIQYMNDNSSLADTDIISEVERGNGRLVRCVLMLKNV